MTDAMDSWTKSVQPSTVSHREPEAASRVERLLAQLSVREKVGQMTQHALFERPGAEGDGYARLLGDVRRGEIGAFLNVKDRELRNELQRVALEEGRVPVPLLFGRDVIHGYDTIFPIPLGLAASFDAELVEQVGAAAAREASEAGIDWTFAPMVDVTREPRWGRVAEGFGEDPWLVSELGAAMVRGFQGRDPSEPGRIAACVKHYLGYGAAEAGKEYNTTWIPEPLLRDVYLPPFRACVEAGALTVMCGFNDLNGMPMSGHRWALRDVLKGELGFRGFVLSDWASVQELIAHGACADAHEAAREAVRAGVDMEMATRVYKNELVRLVESGEVPLALLDDAVRRILEVKQRLGLFERPYRERPTQGVALSPQHLALARRAARASFVLLHDRGACLPLARSVSSLCVVGPLADDRHNPLGSWSFDGDRAASVTLLAALRERLPAVQLSYEPGLPEVRSEDKGGFDAAFAAVAAAEVALVVVGEDANISGECRSRAFLGLPGAQSELLERLAGAGTPLVVIVMAGRPLTLGREAQLASALLYAWQPGTMTGPALVDVLFGDTAPSGKLPITFPRTVGQVPIYYNHKNTGRPPKRGARGIPAGTPLDPIDMDASYLDVEVTPEFPFGFGLSYTTFAYSELRVSPARGGPDSVIEVSARLENTGRRSGVEVAQLYVRDRVGSLTRPVRELKRAERIELAAGDSQRLVFQLPARELGFWGRDASHALEPGKFEIFVGGDSRATLTAEFELES
jgi:beta-glucosidase